MGRVHHKGIVHRDLKPANILMTESDEPKVGDFGLARALLRETAGLSKSKIMGTVEYMSPEQARGGSRLREIAAPADVFALGVILFELLTGELPFHSDSQLETLNLVSEAKPRPPRTLRPGIPRDLESICLMCLRKEPGARYADGLELAGDLDRFLRGAPIRARHVGRAERAWLWAVRNPLATALIAAAVVGASLAVGVGSENTRRRLAEANERVEKSKRLAVEADANTATALAAERGRQVEFNAYLGRINAADRAIVAGRRLEAAAALDACPPALRDWEWRNLNRRINSERLRLKLVDGQGATIDRARMPLGFDAGGSRLVVAPGFSIASGDGAFPTPETIVGRLDRDIPDGIFSPDGSLSAAIERAGGRGGPDGSRVNVLRWTATPAEGTPGPVKFTREIQTSLRGHTGRVVTVAFSPDSRRLATVATDGTLRVWDAATGGETGRLDLTSGSRIQDAHVAFSPNGRTVAALFWRSTTVIPDVRKNLDFESVRELAVWDVGTARARFPAAVQDRTTGLRDHDGDDLTFSPDGGTVAFAASDRSITLVDARTGRLLRTLAGHPGGASGVKLAFLPDGLRLLSAGRDRLVKVWRLVAEGGPERVIVAHDEAVVALAVSPDGRRIATADWTEAKLWDVDRLGDSYALDLPPGEARVFAIDPRGRYLATEGASAQPEVVLWNLATGRLVARLKLVDAGAAKGVVHPLLQQKPDILMRDEVEGLKVLALAFSPDGATLAIGTGLDPLQRSTVWPAVEFWDVEKRAHLWTSPRPKNVSLLAFSADSRRVYGAGEDQQFACDVWTIDLASRAVAALPIANKAWGLLAHPTRREMYIAEFPIIPDARVVRVETATNQVLGSGGSRARPGVRPERRPDGEGGARRPAGGDGRAPRRGGRLGGTARPGLRTPGVQRHGDPARPRPPRAVSPANRGPSRSGTRVPCAKSQRSAASRARSSRSNSRRPATHSSYAKPEA